MASWYPCDPNHLSGDSPCDTKGELLESELQKDSDRSQLKPWEHHTFSSGKVSFTSCNQWPKKISKHTREKVRRKAVVGVEVRDLGPGHLLEGEQGLFATKQFHKFDVIGEYTGEIVPADVCGHYVACLEDKEQGASVGLNAEFVGNELRFINSHIGIAFYPNVCMKTVYIDTFPRIIIICTADTIALDEELLLDYGENYNRCK
jgi:hypothetical protein